MVKRNQRTTIRTKIRVAAQLATDADGLLAVNSTNYVTGNDDWTYYATLFEEYKINSITFRYVPAFRPASNAELLLVGMSAFHNPGQEKTFNAPADLQRYLEGKSYEPIHCGPANGPLSYKVPVSDPETWYATEDEATHLGSNVQMVGFIWSGLVSKQIGHYIVEWDLSFRN